MRLSLPRNGVVVVAGIAGAGKTTFIRDHADRATTTVVDPEDLRDGARIALPSKLLHLRHFLLTLRAVVFGDRPVIIHSRGTSRLLRRVTAGAAALRGREAHLLLLDAGRAAAEAGQRERGRTISQRRMDRESALWDRVLAAARTSGALRRERWSSVTVLSREEATALELCFTAAAAPAPVLA